jgi:hypothetical protein
MAITSAEVHKIMQHLSRTVDLLISRLRLHLQKKYLFTSSMTNSTNGLLFPVDGKLIKQ